MEQRAVNIRHIYDSLLLRCFTTNEKQVVDDFIVRNDLSEFIHITLNQIEKIAELSNKSIPVDLDEIKKIAYQTLKTFNTAIARIQELEEKIKIKKLLGKFGVLLQMEISQRTANLFPDVISSIDDGLKQAIHAERYDENDFRHYVQPQKTLKDDVIVTDKEVTIIQETDRKEHLMWNNAKANLDKCIKLITKDYFYIKSGNEFRKLFDDTQAEVEIICHDGRINYLIVLFDSLWDKDIIALKGANGFWMHLKNRLVDFRKNQFDFDFKKKAHYLRTKAPSRHMIINEINQIIENIRPKY